MESTVINAERSDQALIELLRRRGELGISDLAEAMDVTATAVRQRLNRLMAEGMVQRTTIKPARGRPSHVYALTPKAYRLAGNNFGDLTIALWQEIREIRDPEVRNGLLKRLAARMAVMYADQINGSTPEDRLQDVARLFEQRKIPFSVERDQAALNGDPQATKTGDITPNSTASLPILTAWACPYPELAEQDRSVCAFENMLLSELVGERVKLTECRLDGGECCRFQTEG